jgi:hypothetical protein
MSVTHLSATFTPVPKDSFAGRYPQFAPFLVTAAIVAASIAVALVFTGLPT